MSDKEFPLVTIVACCYNHERFVEECLDSIRMQTYPNVQLIITDDCSSDNSVAVINKWMVKHNVRCVFIVHEQNMGLPRTLNEALEYVAGKYVSLMSTDDIMMPRKIEEQTKIFESGPDDVGIVFSKSYFMDENGESLAYEPGEKWQNQYHEGYVLEHLLERNFIIAPSMLVRRSCYDRVGGYDTSLVYEDYDMNLRIAEFYQFRYSDYVSARYRVHGNSMARSRSKKVQHSKIQIYFKWLERKPELKELLEARITAMAKDLYEARHPRRNYFLWKAFVQSYRLSSLLMCAYSFLDIPYSCYDASMRAWGGFADFRRGRI